MADLSDVSNALGALIGSALYPGQVTPSGNSVAGLVVSAWTGWPDPDSLDAIVTAAKASPPSYTAQVTVYPRPTEKNTTRYPRTWQQNGALQAITFTLTLSGQTVTVVGSQPATFYGQNFAVFVNGKAYVYRTVSNDTLASIASALAVLIAIDVPGTSASGAVITVTSPARIGALRVGSQAPTGLEAKRQEREFQLTVWAPTPAYRDLIAEPIDVAIGITPWLTLADGSKGRLIYKGAPFTDFDQKQGLYRRDLIVSVEYATIATGTATEAIAIETQYFTNESQVELSNELADLIQTEGGGDITITPPDITTYT